MRIASIEEIPPRFSYEAYFPVAETDPEWRRASAGLAVEVLSLRAFRSATPRRGKSMLPAFGVVTEVRPARYDNEVDLVLGSPGRVAAVASVSAAAAEQFPEGTVFHDPQLLVRGKFRLRPVKVEFVPDPYQDPWTSEVWLPIARVHRPARDGCVTTLTVTDTSIKEYDAGFEFAGNGVGGSVKFTAQFERVFPASKTCKEARVRARLTLYFGNTLENGTVVSSGSRLVISDVDPSKRGYADLPAVGHGCEKTQAELPKGATVNSWDLSDATGGIDDSPTDSMKIAKETSGSVSVGLEFGKLPFQMSIGYTRTSAHEVELATRFAPGAQYLGYRVPPTNQVEKFWTVLA